MASSVKNHFNCYFNTKENIFEGIKMEAKFDPNLSVGQVLFMSLKENPENIIQIDDSHHVTITNDQVLKWSIRIALRLQEMDFGHNDIVGISAKNSTYLLPVALGCFFNGTPFHAVNPDLDEETVRHCFGLTKPKLLFCDGEVYEKIKTATEKFCRTIITLTEHLEKTPNVLDLLMPVVGQENYEPQSLVEGPQQTVAILCSSGTTGKPKAVCIAKSGVLIENVFLKRDTLIFVPSSIDWYTGLWFTVNNCLSNCTRIISNQSFHIDLFLELVHKYKLSYAFLSSRHVAMLVAQPNVTKDQLASLKIINFGGSNLSEATLKRLNQLFSEDVSINFTYGITEVGPISFNFDKTHPKSVGKLMPNLKIKIINDKNENLGINEVGEVLIKAVVPWPGYYGNDEETAKALDKEFWFHTGDMGYFDENHLLYLVDRKRETCKYRGIYYWPNEIQFVISEIPDVLDVCVVAYEDEKDGDLAGALVVKAQNSSLTTGEIEEHVRRRLTAHYKQLHAGAHFVEQLPYNSNNKCTRNKAKLILRKLVDNKLNNNP